MTEREKIEIIGKQIISFKLSPKSSKELISFLWAHIAWMGLFKLYREENAKQGKEDDDFKDRDYMESFKKALEKTKNSHD